MAKNGLSRRSRLRLSTRPRLSLYQIHRLRRVLGCWQCEMAVGDYFANTFMKQNTAHYGIFGLIPITVLFYVLSAGSFDVTGSTTSMTPVSVTHGIASAGMIQRFQDVQDTLFTTDSVYLVVDLQKQDVTVHKRDKRPVTFLISSGNPWIHEGMATPTGIFTVQNKVPMAISRQFNDARLHHWIGVNGGIGFHGLDGNGYYGYLGKRPSSHGCLRMAREDIREMYNMIHVGAPILVRNGEPARVVAFCDEESVADGYVIDSSNATVRGIGKERIAALYNGQFFVEPTQPLVHLAGTRVSWHIDAGLKSRIPRQRIAQRLALPDLTETMALPPTFY